MFHISTAAIYAYIARTTSFFLRYCLREDVFLTTVKKIVLFIYLGSKSFTLEHLTSLLKFLNSCHNGLAQPALCLMICPFLNVCPGYCLKPSPNLLWKTRARDARTTLPPIGREVHSYICLQEWLNTIQNCTKKEMAWNKKYIIISDTGPLPCVEMSQSSEPNVNQDRNRKGHVVDSLKSVTLWTQSDSLFTWLQTCKNTE